MLAFHRRKRHGVILPLVLITLLLVALLSAAAQTQAWRAMRSSRLAFNGARALLNADELLAIAISRWDANRFAAMGIGARRITRLTATTGEAGTVTITRLAPLIAWIESETVGNSPGVHNPLARRVGRAITLEPPTLPIDAAFVALSPVEVRSGASIIGTDTIVAGDDCGPWRDTASVIGIRARELTTNPGAITRGRPPTSGTYDSLRAATQFDAAWSIITTSAIPRSPPPPAATVAPDSGWPAIRFTTATPLSITGDVTHVGLLAVDGDLIVHGRLRVRGLLIVRGTLDVPDGQLQIDGALALRDPNGRLSTLGGRTTVRYRQCTVRRALAAVSVPHTAPWQQWSQR